MSDPATNHPAALKQRLAALDAGQRALLARRLAAGRNRTAGSARAPGAIPKIKPLRVVENSGVALYPVSLSQQRTWFLHRYASDSAVYNSPYAFRLDGPLNHAWLEAAFCALIQRHDVLRTTFAMDKLELCQCVAADASFRLQEINLENVPADARLAAAEQRLDEAAGRPFDLAVGPLFRAVLVRLQPTEHMLVIVLHHIISDGWSRSNICRELSMVYTELAAGRQPGARELPVQFADFSAWQRDWLAGGTLAEQTAYWKGKLANRPGPLELPADRPRPATESFRGGICSQPLDPQLAEALKLRAQDEGATFFMILLAAFKTLLYRYTGQDDLMVGVPIASRPRPELEELIGYFANTLLLRTTLQPGQTFRELLRQVKETAVEAYAHQDLPVEQLISMLDVRRDASRPPLFQVSFAVQDFPAIELNFPGVQSTPWPVSTHTSKFDFTFTIERSATGWLAVAEYSTDLFDASRVKRMLEHWRVILQGIVSDPDQPISKIPLLTPPERQQILVDWNRTERNYPSDKCLHQLFEEQAQRTPDAVAVEFEGTQLTYRELDHRARRLAVRLQAVEVGPDVLVGLCVERSLEMIVGMLGIQKAGGAYVPLDPKYPKERVEYILQDAGASVVVTQRSLDFGQGVAHRVYVEETTSDVSLQNGQRPDNGHILSPLPSPSPRQSGERAGERGFELNTPETHRQVPTPANLAYVMYTSGSTGRPKGVAIEHRNVVSFIRWVRDAFTDVELSAVLASTSMCFDLSVFEIFSPLSWGGRVVVVHTALDLASPRAPKNISLINTVQSVLLELLRVRELPPSIRTVNMGGEALRQSAVETIFKKSSAEYVNDLYGPTETTIYSTWARRQAGGFENVGRPIANTQLYILDPQGQPVPVGIQGELHIGGAGVARGYWRRPELTAGRFVSDPFGGRPGARLFKTGDRARWLPDGTLVLLGRADGLVKLRGFRIELCEIETALRAAPEIREAAVVLREDTPGDERLVAYLVSHTGKKPDMPSLRNRLMATLPEYMVPVAFVWLDRFPLTPNGKVDRNALPVPTQTSAKPRETEQPVTVLELELIRIWQQLFQQTTIGRNDNFFELGGHSLLAIRLTAEIEKLAGRNVPIAALFQAPTVAALARKLEDENWVTPRTSLVPLQTAGSELPVFCVHGIYGEVFVFLDLARALAPDRPVYGLQAVGLDGRQPRHTTIEEMAAHYAREIRSLQRVGPYHLVGASLGGWIAHAVAQELTRSGGKVGLLALLDTRASARVPWSVYARAMAPHLAGRMGVHLKKYLAGPENGRLHYLKQKLAWFGLQAMRTRRNLPLRPLAERLNDSNRHNFTIDYFEAVVARYRPRKYPGDVTIFAGYDAKNFRPAAFWKHFVTGRVQVNFVAGGHGSLLHHEHVAQFAQIFRKTLKKAEADVGLAPVQNETDAQTLVVERPAT